MYKITIQEFIDNNMLNQALTFSIEGRKKEMHEAIRKNGYGYNEQKIYKHTKEEWLRDYVKHIPDRECKSLGDAKNAIALAINPHGPAYAYGTVLVGTFKELILFLEFAKDGAYLFAPID